MTDAAAPGPGTAEGAGGSAVVGTTRTDRTAPAGTATATVPRSRRDELFTDGWALVVQGPGLKCDRLAKLVVEQCRTRGVDVEAVPVDAVRMAKLYRYTMIFLVLEAPPPSRKTSVTDMFTAVYAEYRRHRPKGLASVLRGECDWRRAGPVHVVLWGDDQDFADPALAVLDQACAKAAVTDHRALRDLFESYGDGSMYNPEEALLGKARLDWQYLRSWNILSPADVPAILRIIERCIEHYRNPALLKSSKPLPGISEYNRLELVLYAPHLKPMAHDTPGIDLARHKKNVKNFNESGAAVVRHTLRAIRHEYPEVERPNDRSKTKDNVPEFKRLFDALTLVNAWPAALHQRIVES